MDKREKHNSNNKKVEKRNGKKSDRVVLKEKKLFIVSCRFFVKCVYITMLGHALTDAHFLFFGNYITGKMFFSRYPSRIESLRYNDTCPKGTYDWLHW